MHFGFAISTDSAETGVGILCCKEMGTVTDAGQQAQPATCPSGLAFAFVIVEGSVHASLQLQPPSFPAHSDPECKCAALLQGKVISSKMFGWNCLAGTVPLAELSVCS